MGLNALLLSHPYYIYKNGFNIILDSHIVDNDLTDLMIITYKVKKFIEEQGIKTNVIVNRNRVYDKDEKYEHQHAWLIPTDMSLFINLICRKDEIPTKGSYPKTTATGIQSLDDYNNKYRRNKWWTKRI